MKDTNTLLNTALGGSAGTGLVWAATQTILLAIIGAAVSVTVSFFLSKYLKRKFNK